MPAHRGTTNKYHSGNATDRRVRKQWLLEQFGDGQLVACYLQISLNCALVLDEQTLTVDRVLPGMNGGRYVRGTILPACGPCTSMEGARGRWGNGPWSGPTFDQRAFWALAPLLQSK
jgi:hypothetical protein